MPDKITDVLDSVIREVGILAPKRYKVEKLIWHSAILEIFKEMLGEERVHSQLCKKNFMERYGKQGAFEGNCGCIAYGYNLALQDIRAKIEELKG